MPAARRTTTRRTPATAASAAQGAAEEAPRDDAAADAREVAAIEAEAADRAEAEEAPHPYTASAELCGEEVRALPASAWRASVMRAMAMGDYDTFFAAVLHPDDVDVYIDADPTQGEILAFMSQVGVASQVELGKSVRRGRLSPGMRRR